MQETRKADAGVLSGANSPYLEELYELYSRDPAQVSEQWRSFFANGMDPAAAPSVASGASSHGQLAVSRLIDSYRQLGCRIAAIDPLVIDERPLHPSLEMSMYGLGEADQEKTFDTDIPGLPSAPLQEIVSELHKTYCGTISAEFMHITDPQQRRWFIENYESCRAEPELSAEEKMALLERMVAADALENYLNTRYTGQKRFSLEGGDALIPMMDTLTREAMLSGAAETCIGMAHRGRLNLLINLLGKNPQDLFDEFEGKSDTDHYGSGDVKYHMGFSSNLSFKGKVMHLWLAFNPSHLEIVNPVVEGSVWARQVRRRDQDGSLVLPVLVHGDAALAGQGICMETLNMSLTRGYSTGGTIHIAINNQVGFTTSEIADARSTYWCTDLAKMVESPVLHVNGNDPEVCALAVKLALAYRNTFHRDVFIDLVCYRRHGHNEQDEPRVTQPYMYSKVAELPNPATFYANKLEAEGVIDTGHEAGLREAYVALMKEGKAANPLAEPANTSKFVDWSHHAPGLSDWNDPIDTSISEKQFKDLGERLSTVPEDFTPHNRVQKIIESRAKMAQGEEPLDWGMAENLAYASILAEGHPVRLSGQDVGRGTFFHRHAVWHDQKRSGRTGETYIPLEHVAAGQPYVKVVDSLLSEAAVLGFEYGVSLSSPNMLTIWEAQFGDFANSAQVVIDQFITSGEFKWARLSGLTLLLPHGYEGQGPEHSSARIERYLQLCAEYNIQVCIPSTAAQIFHLLRRQIHHPLRRPLIVMTPKSLLRNKEVASEMSEFTNGRFKPLIGEADESIKPDKVKKLLVCSGKIYYELVSARKEKGIDDIAIIRMEQIYPFPHGTFGEQIQLYSEAKTVCWCQEEPGNQGAWHRIQHYLRRHMQADQELRYALRRSSASTAAGKASLHKEQQQEIIEAALKIDQ